MQKDKETSKDKICVNCMFADFDENCAEDCCICKKDNNHPVIKNNNDTCKNCKVAQFKLTEKGFFSLMFCEYFGEDIFTDERLDCFMECFFSEMKMYGYYLEGNFIKRFFKKIKLYFLKEKPTAFEIFSKNVFYIFGKEIPEKDVKEIWENFIKFVS